MYVLLITKLNIEFLHVGNVLAYGLVKADIVNVLAYGLVTADIVNVLAYGLVTADIVNVSMC